MRRLLAALLIAAPTSCVASAPPTAAPATTFAIPTRSPAPAASAIPPSRRGILVATGGGLAIRAEAGGGDLGVVDLDAAAVSPDGRRLAGWTRTRPIELRVVDVGATTTPARVVALPPGERGVDVVWSVDGQGLLFSVAGDGAPDGGAPAYAALRGLALGGAVREVVRYDGVTLRPAEWDPRSGTVVALVVERGAVDIARELVVLRVGVPPLRRPLPPLAWQGAPAVTGDGAWMVLAATDAPTLRTFAVDDPAFLIEYHGTTGGAQALGRPRSADVTVLVDGELALWQPSTGLRRTVATDVRRMLFFRPDGAALAVTTSAGASVLIDLTTGERTPLPDGAVLGVTLP